MLGPVDDESDESAVIPARPQRYPHPRNVYRTAWGTWYVQVQHNGERLGLGSYVTMEEAVEVRDAFWASVKQASSTDASTAPS
jgi:hypothetical protein